MFTIRFAKSRGFCFGVKRSLAVLDDAIQKYGTPLYVRHHIIHNRFVVEGYEKRGVVFVEDLRDIPAGSTVIFSAHGTAPQVYAQAEALGLTVADATCPLVTKVHTEAVTLAGEGHKILYLGGKTHAEALGVWGEAPESIIVAQNREDIDAVDFASAPKWALLTQTTLSADETRDLIRYAQSKCPNMVVPRDGDICRATQDRQNAVKELAETCDTILVVGSKESSNTRQLQKTAEKAGVRAFLVENADAITDEMFAEAGRNGGGVEISDKKTCKKRFLEYIKTVTR